MLNFPRETATTMALRFAGFEIPYESEDMGDVIGELANVLAGDLCAQLDAKGVRGDMSLPTVVRASDMSLMLPEGLPSVEMHFSSPVGQFSLKLVAGDPRSLIGRKPGS
jgi:CheY-specific phosphatase CheX